MAGELGLAVVARLKENLPELAAAVEERFGNQPPARVHYRGRERIEIWEADDFDPWEGLRWETVRMVRYRQYKPDGACFQADWLTNLSQAKAGGLAVYRMAKSRWEIENQGFNDAKNRYGLAHVCHHHANSILVNWLLTLLAMVIERLYRLRYLHRGVHPVVSAEQFCRRLWLSLGRPAYDDTS